MELLPRAAGAIGLVPISAPPPGLTRVDTPQAFGPYAPLAVPDSWKGKKPAVPVKVTKPVVQPVEVTVEGLEPVEDLPPVRRKKG